MAQGRINFTVGINTDKTGFNTLKSELQQIKNLTEQDLLKVDASAAVSELNKVQKEAQAIENALEKSFNQKLNTNNISTFNKELNKSGFTLDEVIKDWNRLNSTTKAIAANLTATLITSNKNLRESSKLLDKMAETMANTVRWTIASSAVNAITGAVQKAYSFTKDLDESLNDIQIVTGKGADEMARFAKQATTAAQQLGAVTTDYTRASLIYYQQGLSEEEVAARSETTVKVANITGQSADAVSEQLTAVWNGYKVSAEESEMYIDKLAKVAATTAADLEELSTGMSKVASAANIMGVDIDQLNAQLATIVSVTREAPESIGTALKTVYARMSDIEAGLDTETTLGEYTAQMAQMGINALDANGHLRDMGDVVEEIGNQWNSLTREQQTSLAQTIAGTRQYSRMMALFDNWDMYQSAKADSASATGTIAKQNEQYLDSLEAHLNQLTAEAEKLYQTLFNADDIKPLIDVLTNLVGVVNNLVSGLGGGKGLLGIITTVGLTAFGDKLASGIGKASRNMKSFITGFNDAKVMEELTKKIAEDQQVSETAAGRIAKIKKEQLEIEKYLSKEEQEKVDALIKEVAVAEQKKEQLQEEQKIADKISDKVLSQRSHTPAARAKMTDEQKAAEMDSAATILKDKQKFASQTFNTFDEIIALSDQEAAKKRSASYQDKQYDKAQEIIGGDYSDEARAEAAVAALKAQDRSSIAYAEAMALHEQKIEKLDEVLSGAALTLEDMAQETKDMADLEVYSEEDIKRLKEMEKIFNKLKDKEAEDLSDTDLSNLAGAYRDFVSYSQTVQDEINKTAKTLRTSGKEIDDLEAKIKAAEEANKKFVESFNTEKVVSAITDITSGVMSYGAAVEQISSLGDIWSDEDLTTGEKLLQTLLAISSASGLLLNGWKQTKDGLSSMISMLDAYNQKITAKMAADEAASAQNLKNAATSKIKAESTEEESEETDKDTVANVVNALSEEVVQKENKESGDSSLEKADKTEIESNGTDQDTNVNLKGAGKGALQKLKSAGQGIGKFVSSHSALIGGVTGALIAITATVAMLDYANNKQAKAWEQAKEAADRATSAAAEAQNEWESLSASFDKLSSGEDTLANLTKGTVEWKKALLDINAEVLSLIEKYPELQQYVSTDTDGKMSISQEGLEAVQEKQLAVVQTTQARSILANQKERDAEIEYLKDEWADQATYGSEAGEGWANAGAVLAAGGTGLGVGAAAGTAIGGPIGTIVGGILGGLAGVLVGGVSIGLQELAEENNKKKVDESPEFLKIAALYETHGDKIFASESALAAALGNTDGKLSDVEKALYDSKEATMALVKAYNANQAQLWSERVALGATAIGSDASVGIQLLAGKAIEDIAKSEEKIQDVKSRYEGQNDKDIAAAKVAAEYLGLDPDEITAEGSNKVQFVTGNDSEEYTMDEIYEIIAQKEATEEVAANEEKYAAIMKPLEEQFSSKNVSNLVATMAKGTVDFSALSLGEIEEAKLEEMSEAELKAFADAYGTTTTALKTNWDTGINNITATLDVVTEDFPSHIKTAFENLNIDLSALSVEQYKEFAEGYKLIFEGVGEEAAADYQKILQAAGSSSDDLIKRITDTDWGSIDNVEEEIDNITEELGITLPEGLSYSLDSIVRILSGNVKSLAQMQQEYAELQALMDKATMGAEWSAEEYEKLSAEQEKYFAVMADGTAVLIGDAYELRNALQESAQQDARKNALAAVANLNLTTEAMTDARIAGDQEKYAELAQKSGEDTAAFKEAFYQYALTARNEDELQAIWNDKNFRGLARGNIGGEKYNQILESINIANLATNINKTAEETAQLYNAFDGDASAVMRHVASVEKTTYALEQSQKKLEKINKQFDLLGETAQVRNFETQMAAYNEVLTDADEKKKTDLKDIEARFMAIRDSQGVNWGSSGINIASLYDDDNALESWNGSKLAYLNTGITDETTSAALWEMDALVKEYAQIREDAEELKESTKLEILNEQLENFQRKLSIALSPHEAQKEYSEFIRNLADENDFKKIQETYLSDFESQLGVIKAYQDQIAELNNYTEITSTTAVTNATAKVMTQAEKEAQLAQLRSDTMNGVIDLQGIINSLQENYLAYVEAVNNAYEKQVGFLEAINSSLEHQKTMMELLYGEEASNKMSSYYEKNISNAQAIVTARKNQFDQAKTALTDAQASGDADLIAAAEEQYKSVGESYFTAINDLALAHQESYIYQSEQQLKEFQDNITGIGSEATKEQWDWMQAEVEDYLDILDASFAIADIESSFNKAINATTSIKTQQKLNDLKEQELKILKEKDKLTQYDVDRAQKQLDLLQARIALEDAQESKTQMRLMRNANGTYSYQYVADQNAIDEAREKLNKAQQELVNLDEEQLKSNLEKAYDIYDEWMTKVAELWQSGDMEELERVSTEYAERLQGYGVEVNQAFSNLGASVDSAAALLGEDSDLASIFPWTDSQWMQTMTETTAEGWKTAFSSTLTELQTLQTNYRDALNTDFGYNADDEEYGIANDLTEFSNSLATIAGNWGTAAQDLVDANEEAMTSFTTAISKLNGILDSLGDAVSNLVTPGEANAISFPTSWEVKQEDNTWKIQAAPASAETGMYTGAWGPEGKLAVLHEKELVLNKQDTENILSAVDLVRSLGNSMINTMAFMSSGYDMSAAAWELAKEMIIEQTVNITAEFPNASERAEIEAAFEELLGMATQKAYENKR